MCNLAFGLMEARDTRTRIAWTFRVYEGKTSGRRSSPRTRNRAHGGAVNSTTDGIIRQ
jgi:hypothetical protein